MWWMLAVHAINWHAGQWLMRKCVTEYDRCTLLQRVRWDGNCLGVYMYVIISTLYARAVWWGEADAGHSALRMHCWMTAFEGITYAILRSSSIETSIHHVIVLSFLLPTLWSGQPLWCVWLCGLVEVTNVPLSLVYMLKQAGRQRHLFYGVCGGLLWLLYIPFRLILLPAAFVYSFHEAGVRSLWTPLVWYGRVTILVLWALSLFWFVRISDGLRAFLVTNKKTVAP